MPFTSRAPAAALACLAGFSPAIAAGERDSVYPVAAVVRSGADDGGVCFVERSGGSLSHADGECVADVGRQTFEALQAESRRLFRTPAPDVSPDLMIDISILDARSSGSAGLHTFAIAASIRVSTSDQAELDHFRIEEEADAMGDSRQALANGFGQVADAVAKRFGREFANSEPIVRWLLARGIAPAGSSILGPSRGDLVGFFDAAGGITPTSAGGGSWLSARLGVEARWLVVQASIGKWSVPWGPADGVSATALGLELGPVLRLGRNWELRATAGIHFVSGSLDASASTQYVSPPRSSLDFSRKLPSLSAALQYALWPRWKAAGRVRAGLELRKYFEENAVFEEIRTIAPTAGLSIGFSLGIELPIIESPRPPLLLD
jgi:hypothetical protein